MTIDKQDPRDHAEHETDPRDSTGRELEADARARLFGDAPSPDAGGRRKLTRGSLVDRYLLLGTLGAGGMGIVYAAYDPELDRKLALKLVSPRAKDRSGVGKTRLLREAQALAKLSHPNVVNVHDVGTHEEQVWIAMEFVAGQTLGAWAKERPRPWTQSLQVLADAARGVAAAHAAGLVHRDLKPDNVMVGRDGRVRVMDFGLAHGRSSLVADQELTMSTASDSTGSGEQALRTTLETDPEAQPGLAALALQLTKAGVIQGTPAYMAPEQWRGQEAEAAADQFGWSVMAWELLYGERPFAGATVMDVAKAVLSGQRRAPRRGRSVPGWLRKVVERGLATEPAQRWPTMAALLSALERGKTRARVRIAAVVVAGVVLLGAGAEGYRRWDIAQRVAVCEASGAEIDEAWNDDARQRLREAFTATGLSYAETVADKVMPWLDQRAEAWKQARTEVCLNTDVRGVWREDQLDRAVWCLEDRQMELVSLVAEFGRAGPTTTQKAVNAVAGLRAVDACLDEALLQRQPAPPAQGREAIQDVRTMLSRAQALGLAGKLKDALAVAKQAREQAATVREWPPLLAAARAREGDLLERTGAYEEAETACTEAYFVASRLGAWDEAARAADNLVFIVGYRRARLVDGRAWAQHAEMALVHAGDPGNLGEAALLNNLAAMHEVAGAYAEARALHERALAIREHTMGPLHPAVAASLNNLANLDRDTGAYAEARMLHERALAIREQALGPSHPEVATSLTNLANVYMATGAYAKALALNERALAIQEQALGREDPKVASILNNLAGLHYATGVFAKALALHERALAIREKKLEPGHPDIAGTLNNLAATHMAMGTYTEARALFERALALREQTLGPDHPSVGAGLNNLALVHMTTGSYAEARGLYERALAITEKALGPDHPEVAVYLGNLGEAHLAEKRPQDALPLLERALTIHKAHDGVQEGELAACFNLARALFATRGDRARALALANRARDGFREAGAGQAKELADAEQWLAEHGGK